MSTKMDKTVVVAVIDRVRHRRYGKTMQRTSHLYAHDEANDAHDGDRVRLAETRPMSRQKRWRVVEVLERADDCTSGNWSERSECRMLASERTPASRVPQLAESERVPR